VNGIAGRGTDAAGRSGEPGIIEAMVPMDAGEIQAAGVGGH
jgi:hypothetical protein